MFVDIDSLEACMGLSLKQTMLRNQLEWGDWREMPGTTHADVRGKTDGIKNLQQVFDYSV